MAKTLEIGDTVKCLSGDIDRRRNEGAIGRVTGFARLSHYHPREVAVSDAAGNALGWFWVSNVEIIEAD
jgi:hypothetical protein